ncbi:MAG: biopolymer transporter ExbD [Gemmatimonadales bacterium]|nr:MAG: biopolymer transporter ExbD [Gemmatimonadales bacterium]
MAILRKKSKVSDEIPSSSMADIAFLLLIFFLVTTIFPRDRGLQIVLPEADQEIEIPQRNILHINVQPNGMVVYRRGDSEQETTVAPRDMQQIWRQEVAENPNLIAGVQTHPDAEHRYMIQTLDALQLAGSTRISLQIQDGG